MAFSLGYNREPKPVVQVLDARGGWTALINWYVGESVSIRIRNQMQRTRVYQGQGGIVGDVG